MVCMKTEHRDGQIWKILLQFCTESLCPWGLYSSGTSLQLHSSTPSTPMLVLSANQKMKTRPSDPKETECVCSAHYVSLLTPRSVAVGGVLCV